MARQGIVFSQEGVPIESAADYQLVMDSRRKSLEIITEFVVDKVSFPAHQYQAAGANGTSFQKVILFEHGLPFIPMFESSISQVQVSGPNTDSVQTIIDERYVYAQRTVIANSFNTPQLIAAYDYQDTEPICVRTYNINFSEEYQAPAFDPVQSPNADTNYGAKFLHDDTGRIDDPDSYKFSLNSDYKALMVTRHGKFFVSTADADPGNAKQGFVGVEHKTGYPPSYIIVRLTESGGKYIPGPLTGFSNMYVKADSVEISFRGVQSVMSGWYGYVIMTDPSEVAA